MYQRHLSSYTLQFVLISLHHAITWWLGSWYCWWSLGREWLSGRGRGHSSHCGGGRCNLRLGWYVGAGCRHPSFVRLQKESTIMSFRARPRAGLVFILVGQIKPTEVKAPLERTISCTLPANSLEVRGHHQLTGFRQELGDVGARCDEGAHPIQASCME